MPTALSDPYIEEKTACTLNIRLSSITGTKVKSKSNGKNIIILNELKLG